MTHSSTKVDVEASDCEEQQEDEFRQLVNSVVICTCLSFSVMIGAYYAGSLGPERVPHKAPAGTRLVTARDALRPFRQEES